MSSFDLAAFKAAFAADKAAALSEETFQGLEKGGAEGQWSVWRCTYDYASDNESLDATKEIVNSFMNNTKPIAEKVFGVMLVLEPGLEIEGIWIVNGADPEDSLYANTEDTSWFSWSQLGPSMMDVVRKEIVDLMTASSDYKGKTVSDIQVM